MIVKLCGDSVDGNSFCRCILLSRFSGGITRTVACPTRMMFMILMIYLDMCSTFSLQLPMTMFNMATTHTTQQGSKMFRLQQKLNACSSTSTVDESDHCDDNDENRILEQEQLSVVVDDYDSAIRRLLLLSGATVTAFTTTNTMTAANAAVPSLLSQLRGSGQSSKSNSLYVVSPEKNITNSVNGPSNSGIGSNGSGSSTSSNEGAVGGGSGSGGTISQENRLTSEYYLLKLLPVKNKFFRSINSQLDGLSKLTSYSSNPTSPPEPDAWKQALNVMESTVSELDSRRSALEPVFNPDDTAIMQIQKAERGEKLIDALRSQLVDLTNSIRSSNVTSTKVKRRNAMLALSRVGELLVSSSPYEVPPEGKFSFLPRLAGRAEVTFTIRRKNRNTPLGNITIVADGFAAPITAGNFVDLCLRNFYTGLPIKFSKKRLSSGSDFEVANIPILGSYNEGFYDPLTAQLRRLPLELIRIEKNSGVPKLSYAQGLTALTGQQASLEPTINSKPLLSFEIPGLVAMNHRDNDANSASSEFFCLQENSVFEGKRSLLDGEYAPFGYIIEGYDLFQRLQPNDVIDATSVDEWGELNLVKLRRSSFSEVVQSSEKSNDTNETSDTSNKPP